jgi:phosphotransferase system enzyme I (PtsP)
MSANKDRLALIELLSSIGGEHSEDLRATLDRVALAIATGMEAEVCSLYLFDPQRERIVLRATVGLDRESVGKVSMRLNEGLVGLVLEKDEPVCVPDAISHPRYKYFPETGEERFHTFLGVPVRDHDGRKKPLGVLVAQTLERRKFFLISGCANRSPARKKSGSNIGAG